MVGFVLLAVPRHASAGLPLVFEKNVGQAPSQVKFLARAGAYSIYFGTTDVLFELSKPEGPTSRGRGRFIQDPGYVVGVAFPERSPEWRPPSRRRLTRSAMNLVESAFLPGPLPL
jgi:hypothetical protein